jgi:putative photosynthetic complex assembly protein
MSGPALLTPSRAVLPRAAVPIFGALLVALMLGVAWVRWSGTDIRTPDAATVAQRSLFFTDTPHNSVVVRDAASGALIAEFHGVEGEASFVRGSVRALVRERAMRGIGAEQPFLLSARADGRLTLSDPTTGERLDLESFGPSNVAAYARLLPSR